MSSYERTNYTSENNVTYQRCQYAYEFAIPYITDKKVLDIGCGMGYGSALMANKAKTVVGLDYSQKAIDHNKISYKELINLSFQKAKVPPLPFDDNTFEVITTFQFIEHIAEQTFFLQECLRVLVPNGKLLVTTPNAKKTFARNPFHIKEYSFEEMQTHIKNITSTFKLLGLQGNDKVNSYYKSNQKAVQRLLKWDIFKLHKILPSQFIAAPYNLLNKIMRKKLKKNITATIDISTKDFFLQENNLDETWDIYLIAEKNSFVRI